MSHKREPDSRHTSPRKSARNPAVSRASQTQSSLTSSYFGVTSASSTSAAGSTTSFAIQTSPPVSTTSSGIEVPVTVSRTPPATRVAPASAPHIPTDITKLMSRVADILKLGSGEPQDRIEMFTKLLNDISELDRRIRQNLDVPYGVEMEDAKIAETQGMMDQQIALIATYEKKFDKALESIEEEAYQLVGDDAASTNYQRELERMIEQLKSSRNRFRGGGEIAMDHVVQILHNQFSLFMSIDKKIHEFSSHLQKLGRNASGPSASDSGYQPSGSDSGSGSVFGYSVSDSELSGSKSD